MTISIIEYRPPRIAILLVAIATLVHVLTRANATQFFSSTIVASTLAIGGFAIMMIAWWQFKRHRVALCPMAKTTSLITNGIYRVTRNPMYLGITMMLTALAVWVGTLPFYAAAVAFFGIIQVYFCPFEEAKLRRNFGRPFAEYADSVRRWI